MGRRRLAAALIASYFTFVCRPNFALEATLPDSAGRNGTLSQKELENLDVLIPETAEPQRIAACLSSLDSLIAAQSRKLDGLRVHKTA